MQMPSHIKCSGKIQPPHFAYQFHLDLVII